MKSREVIGQFFLTGNDDTKTIRVEAGDSIGSFAQETINSIVSVTGTLEEQRIDESYLTDWGNEVEHANHRKARR